MDDPHWLTASNLSLLYGPLLSAAGAEGRVGRPQRRHRRLRRGRLRRRRGRGAAEKESFNLELIWLMRDPFAILHYFSIP